MPTYMMLGHLSERGLRIFREKPERFREIAQKITEQGGTLVSHYILLGSYDMAIILKTDDPEATARISSVLAHDVGIISDSLTAIPFEDYLGPSR